jgi:hypothetical protein
MGNYFHVAPILLDKDSRILPGNFGRLLRTYQQANDTLYRETILENIRAQKFPEKPSRLSAIFLLETLAEAQIFRQTCAPFNLIYEVEASLEGLAIHRGNYARVQPMHKPMMESMPIVAEEYWATPPTEHIEIVVQTSVRVLAQRG